MQIQSYKDLIVWRKSFQLVLVVYKLTKKFPKDEIFGLTAQMKRSAISIPSNIAEGFGRGSRADYVRFLYIAYGSAAELETQLLLAKELRFVTENDTEKKEAEVLLVEVLKMLNTLIQKLRVNEE